MMETKLTCSLWNYSNKRTKFILLDASGDFHRFEGNHLSNFDAENWKFGKLSEVMVISLWALHILLLH